jgi:hypothetical protein
MTAPSRVVGRPRDKTGRLLPQVTDEDEFWLYVLSRSFGHDAGGCWEWTGAHTTAGYCTASLNNTRLYLHRFSYERSVGPIPEGLELDHLCRNRGCFNPAHLEAVTHAENMRRGYWGSKTECPQGHPYDEINTQINSTNGARQCRKCIAARKHADYRAKNPEDRSQSSRTHCPRGHEYAGENLVLLKPMRAGGNPRRDCRTCRRASGLARYYRLRETQR